MASVSSTSAGSNTMAALGIKNKGIGGLVSGLDTDSLVEALTSGTRAKIAKQGQDRQLLNWKMTAYRTMATALSAFQKKSFSYSSSSSTNIMSSAFFNTYKATSTSDKVSVRTTSNSVTGNFTIDKVQQLATHETITNKTKLSTTLTSSFTDANGLPTGGLTDGMTMAAGSFTGQTLKLNVDGDIQTIKLDSLNSAIEGGVLNGARFQEGLQALMDKAYGTKNVYVAADEYVRNADTRYRKEGENYVEDENGDYALAPNGETYVKSDSNATVKTEVKNVQVSFGGEGGTLKLDSDSSQIIISASNDLLGLSEGQSNRVLMSTKIGDIDAFKGVLQGDIMKFSINGVTIEVNKNDTLNTLKDKINSSAAGVSFSYSKNTDEFTLTSKKTGVGENIIMRDVQGNLMNTLFGAQSGNSVGTNWLLTKDPVIAESGIKLTGADGTSLASKVSQMEFTLTINGETKRIKADTAGMSTAERNALKNGTLTQEGLLKALNKGIQNSFGSTTTVGFAIDPATGNAKLMSTDPSVAFSASHNMTETDYDALSILGFTDDKVGNTVFDLGYGSSVTAANSFSGLNIPSEGSGVFNLTINGETKEIRITPTDDEKDPIKLINDAIKKAFGADIANKVEMVNSGGKMSLSVKDTNLAVRVSEGTDSADGKTKDIFGALGFSGANVNNLNTNAADGITFAVLASGENLTAGTLTINGKTINYDPSTKVRDFMNAINEAFDDPSAATFVNGKLTIKSPEDDITITDTGNMLEKMFGIIGSGFQTTGEDYGDKHTTGLNAEIVMDGKVISSKSNTFSINGVDVEVNEVSAAGDAPIKIGVKSDPEEVVTKLKEWINDYNAVIATLTAAVNEDKNSNYAPLTDEQKAEMTEDQIKAWETEAKKGILRNDSTLRGILSDLRNTLYQKVASAGISLYDIGITTKSYSSSGVSDAGQLEISDESKLRAMLENNPDKVRLLFTDPNEGLAVKMNAIIDKAAKDSSVNRGSLITLAGTEKLTGNNSSTLGKKIDAIDKYVTALKTRLETEYNRYWKQFSVLETTIQRLNMQSSWLQQS